MLRLALALLHLCARGANAMPPGEGDAWAAAWAHAGVTPEQVGELRVDVEDGVWRVTVRGASFVVPAPRDQAAREDLAALVASACNASLPAPGQEAPTSAVATPPPDRPTDGSTRSEGAPPAWTPYGLLETGVRVWPARDATPSHTLAVGLAGPLVRGELTALVTWPADIPEAGTGRTQTSARLALQMGVGGRRLDLRAGVGAEGSRFMDDDATVARGVLPDVSITLRGRPLATVPLLVSGAGYRTIGPTRLTLAPTHTMQLSPWRLGLSVAWVLEP
jgi:hypothetical protein